VRPPQEYKSTPAASSSHRRLYRWGARKLTPMPRAKTCLERGARGGPLSGAHLRSRLPRLVPGVTLTHSRDFHPSETAGCEARALGCNAIGRCELALLLFWGHEAVLLPLRNPMRIPRLMQLLVTGMLFVGALSGCATTDTASDPSANKVPPPSAPPAPPPQGGMGH
jgi:hypothetical protein